MQIVRRLHGESFPAAVRFIPTSDSRTIGRPGHFKSPAAQSRKPHNPGRTSHLTAAGMQITEPPSRSAPLHRSLVYCGMARMRGPSGTSAAARSPREFAGLPCKAQQFPDPNGSEQDQRHGRPDLGHTSRPRQDIRFMAVRPYARYGMACREPGVELAAWRRTTSEQEVPEDDRGGEPGGRTAAGGCPCGPGLLLRDPRRPHRVSPGADAAGSGRLVPPLWVVRPYRPLSGRATLACGGEAHARLRWGDKAVRPGDGPGPVHVLGPAGPADRFPRSQRGRQDDGHARGVRACQARRGSGPLARCDGLPRGPGPVRLHAGGAGPVSADAGAGPAGLPRPALRAQPWRT